MFIADYHTHSDFSSDSSTPLEENIKKAIDLGLREIAVTDHIDFDYPDPDFPFVFDYAPYKAEIERLKEKYSGKIKIKTGVEVGVQPHVLKELDGLRKIHYDFVIASSHVVDKCDLCTNDFFEGKTKFMAYLGYFADVLNNVKT